MRHSSKDSLTCIKALLRARDGVAAVEFALLAPTLVLLLAGAVSFGDALRVKVEVGNAARAGADWAALQGYNILKIQAAAQGATNLGANVTVAPVLSLAECMDPSSSTPVLDPLLTPCTSTGAPPGLYVTVTTSTVYRYIMPLAGFNMGAVTLSGVAIARVQ